MTDEIIKAEEAGKEEAKKNKRRHVIYFVYDDLRLEVHANRQSANRALLQDENAQKIKYIFRGLQLIPERKTVVHF